MSRIEINICGGKKVQDPLIAENNPISGKPHLTGVTVSRKHLQGSSEVRCIS
jgi:hypothetical protein